MAERTLTDGGEVPVATDRRPTADEAAPVLATTELAAQLDVLRIAVGKTEALATVAVESYDHADWAGSDSLQVEKMAYLLGAVAEAATAAVAVVDRFHTFIADQQPAAAGDKW